jgi:hypothetical protein
MEDEQRVTREVLYILQARLVEMPRAFDLGDPAFVVGSHVRSAFASRRAHRQGKGADGLV